MADDREERFKRLPRGVTADLFEHFGIAAETSPSTLPDRLVEVTPCDNCGWFREVKDRSPCLICGYLGRRYP